MLLGCRRAVCARQTTVSSEFRYSVASAHMKPRTPIRFPAGHRVRASSAADSFDSFRHLILMGGRILECNSRLARMTTEQPKLPHAIHARPGDYQLGREPFRACAVPTHNASAIL